LEYKYQSWKTTISGPVFSAGLYRILFDIEEYSTHKFYTRLSRNPEVVVVKWLVLLGMPFDIPIVQ
jgi:hypothetical protein